MAQFVSSQQANGGGGGPEFHLPDEILAVIPTGPYDQLDLARKITSMAIASRVSDLETETGRLRQKNYEKDRAIHELEEKVSHLQIALQEAESRLQISVDENMRLSKERDSLAMNVKKLSRDLAKLDTFKRQLMQSLSEDSSSPETVDIGTCDQLAPKAYIDKDEVINGCAPHNSYSGSSDTGNTTDNGSRYTGQRFSITPYITPRLTPTGTPNIMSKSVSPQMTSGATSPTKSRNIFSPWCSSSQHSSAANSPPQSRPMPGRGPRIDGKEFFRQARSHLSYEQFSAFLANIKELNSQKQTRDETLRKAEDIFGTDNKDLYLSFQGLLSRNMH